MRRGPRILLTPGPTPLPPQVLRAMSRPLAHHRTREFHELFASTLAGLRRVYRTRNDVLLMTASGTGAMESAAANLLSPGDRAVVHSTGAFGERFVRILKAYGLEPVVVSEEWGRAADPDRLAAALRSRREVKAVFFQHVETSTGTLNDVRALAAAVRRHSSAVSVVDSVSALAAEPLETDAWGLDVVVAGSQKGLMCAPGLAFAAVSERAWRLAGLARLPRFYLDWREMRRAQAEHGTPFTPAISLITGLAAALKLIEEEGLKNVWKRTADLAAFARRRARELGLDLFAERPSRALTSLRLPPGVDGGALLADILDKDGIALARGLGPLKDRIVRVAHMGYISRENLAAGFDALQRRLTSP